MQDTAFPHLVYSITSKLVYMYVVHLYRRKRGGRGRYIRVSLFCRSAPRCTLNAIEILEFLYFYLPRILAKTKDLQCFNRFNCLNFDAKIFLVGVVRAESAIFQSHWKPSSKFLNEYYSAKLLWTLVKSIFELLKRIEEQSYPNCSSLTNLNEAVTVFFSGHLVSLWSVSPSNK